MSAYQAKSSVQSSKKLSKPAERQDLKISFATSEDLGHSKTWRMKSAGTSDNTKNNGRDQEQGDVDDDYENEPIVSHSIQHVWLEHPIPDKLFFLATGEGCGTAEVCKMQISEANCAIYFFFCFCCCRFKQFTRPFLLKMPILFTWHRWRLP